MFYRMLLAATAVTLMGQTPVGQYGELKAALGLTDAQLTQLEQNTAASVPRPAPDGVPTRTPLYPPGNVRSIVIRGAQNQAALRLLDDSQRAKLDEFWHALQRSDALAFEVKNELLTEQQWPRGCICNSEAHENRYSMQLGVTDAQAEQLERIRKSVKPNERREAALAVFNQAQRAQLAEFEAGIQLAHEAVQLCLILDLPRGECLCH